LGIDAMAQRSTDEALDHGLGAVSRDEARGSFDERRIDADLGADGLALSERQARRGRISLHIRPPG